MTRLTREKLSIGYVTDLAFKTGGGGSYAVNWHAYNNLSLRFDTRYCGPIVPRPPRVQTIVSKLRRHVLGKPGTFAYFSEKTLERNAVSVSTCLQSKLDAVFFRSATRWCKVRTTIPYFVYLDAVFHTFFLNTFDPGDFYRSDIDRICEAEAAFLEGATGVFFESRWAMANARDAYSLKGSHYQAVGRGGVIAPPLHDVWDGESRRIVTIAMNFQQKGGDIVAEAYPSLKNRFPELKWHIIGGPPPPDVLTMSDVVYEGVLNPEEPADRARIEGVLSNAFLLLHPTREDTSPLVITEAAYFGCPSVSINAFAIPELVTHGVTGILINSPSTGDLIDAVAELALNPLRYRDMRVNARQRALARDRWEVVGDMIADGIEGALSPR